MAEQVDRERNSEADVKHDRRRPGRVPYTNSALIRMLRRPFDQGKTASPEEINEAPPAAAAPHPDAATDQRGDLAPGHGVVYGAIGGAILWVIIGAALWIVWGH